MDPKDNAWLDPLLNSTAHELLTFQKDDNDMITNWPMRGGKSTAYMEMKSSMKGALKATVNKSAK
jgi:predicted nucleic acid-binding protein